jgi:2-oxoglutarate dehydrogenase E2 component (dihydrolipoamide succinyltransferase)
MVDVTMPQLGETVTEGTITAWLKAPGDWVDEDEALLEVSTDKVDSELPAPASGHLGPLLVAEGDTVPVGTVLTRLSAEPESGESPRAAPVGTPVAAESSRVGGPSASDGDESFLSPAVRRVSAEHGLDPATVEGTGAGGRVTASDVERALADRGAHRTNAVDQPGDSTSATTASMTPPGQTAAPVSPSPSLPTASPAGSPPDPAPTYAGPAAPGTEVIPFTAIRRTTAANLTRSLATAAHTLVVMEVDYHRVDDVRPDAGLTYLPFIARAVIDALADHPHLNAHVAEDHLIVHERIDLGVAVDLDFEGLMVPVVRDAHRLRIAPLAEAMAERAHAAKAGSLNPDDLSGGTFTLTNAGRYGTLFTAPIINRPQAAILSTDGVRTRPVALPLEDGGHGLAFHPVGNLALSFDHRAVDGAYASSFLDRVRTLLETRDWSAELEGGR